MLSPYADLYYLTTDNVSCEKDATEKLNEETEKKEVAEKAGDNKSKDTIDKKNTETTSNQAQRVQIIKEKINEKWIYVEYKGNK